MSIFVIASVIPKPEYANEVEAELRRMVTYTRAEPGNRRYDLFRTADGSPGLHLYEIYDDDAAFEAHRASAHFNAYREKMADWLAQPPVVTVLTAIDVAAG
jgi:quinol monooxygenase YgiN